jgi:hypothetical protein
MQVSKVPEAAAEEQLRAVLAEAGVKAHSISYEAPTLQVKTAYVRLPAPPLPWAVTDTAANGSGLEPTANGAQMASLEDAVEAEEAVPDTGDVNAGGAVRARVSLQHHSLQFS